VFTKSPPRAVTIFSSTVLAIGGVGYVIGGLRKGEYFETTTGAYNLAMATLIVVSHRLSSRVPERPPTPLEQPSTSADRWFTKRPPRAVTILSSIVLAIGGVGWLIGGLRKGEYFETTTGAYTLAMATSIGFGQHLSKRVPERHPTTP
jgi:hypothetical protein